VAAEMHDRMHAEAVAAEESRRPLAFPPRLRLRPTARLISRRLRAGRS
jgi:hypothetical protein